MGRSESDRKSRAVVIVRYRECPFKEDKPLHSKLTKHRGMLTMQQMGWNLHHFTVLTVASDYGLSNFLAEELNSLYLPFFCFSRDFLFWMCRDWFLNYGNKDEFQTRRRHNWFLHNDETDRASVHWCEGSLSGPDQPAGLRNTLLWQVRAESNDEARWGIR